MVRANGRNVSSNIAVKDALGFIKKSISLGLTPNTFFILSSQVFKERFNKAAFGAGFRLLRLSIGKDLGT